MCDSRDNSIDEVVHNIVTAERVPGGATHSRETPWELIKGIKTPTAVGRVYQSRQIR
jgi:hypothetical protein